MLGEQAEKAGGDRFLRMHLMSNEVPNMQEIIEFRQDLRKTDLPDFFLVFAVERVEVANERDFLSLNVSKN